MSLRFARYVSKACIVGTAAWGCGKDSINEAPPLDLAAPADTAGAGETLPPNLEVEGEANGDVIPSQIASSASTANTPATPEVIEPAWSDKLRVCPPSSGSPVVEYVLTRQNHIDEFEGCE